MLMRSHDRTIAFVLFGIALLFCAAITKTHTDSCNDTARLAMIDSLVERGTFRIDASPFVGTCDKYLYHGHFFSDKEPLLILMGAVVAFALRPLHLSLATNLPVAYYLVTLFTVGACFAAAVAYAFLLQRLLGMTRRVALTVCGLTALATPVVTFAIVLANHVPCGAAVLIGTAHALLAARGSRLHAALSGLFFSVAVAFDASAIAFFLVPIALLWRRPPSLGFAFAVATAPLLIAQASFNFVYSGSVVPAAMNGGLWDYAGSYFRNHYLSAGMLGSFWAYVDYARYVTIGDKGLFIYAPLVLVAGYGLTRMWKSGGEQRSLAVGITAACSAFFLLVLLFTDDRTAANYGERRYVDFYPLLCIALGPVLAVLRRRTAVLAVRALAIASIVMAAIGAVSPWTGSPGLFWNLDRFHTLWMHAPVIATVDAAACLAVILASIYAIAPA
jgi:hypothetical protein